MRGTVKKVFQTCFGIRTGQQRCCTERKTATKETYL